MCHKIYAVMLAVLVLAPIKVFAQQPDTLNLGILVDEVSPSTEEILSRLVGEITAVVGTDATIRFTDENLKETAYDPVRAQAMYQSLLDGSPDVILAFGPVSAQAVSGRAEYSKPTILFGTINSDLIALGDDKSSSGIRHFTYVVTSQSYARDLQAFRRLCTFKKVGVVMPAKRSEVSEIRKALQQGFASAGMPYVLIPYQSPASLEPHLDTIDAVYLADSWEMPESEVQTLAANLIEKRIPSFSGARRQDVEMGLMATTHPEENLSQLFRRIALHVASVASGENLSDRPVFVELQETLTINMNTAESIGVPLRYSLIAGTELVGDFVNPLSEQTYGLADMVAEALAENLSIGIERRDIDLAQQDVRTARSSYLPSISAQLTESALDPAQAELAAGQNPQYSTRGSLLLEQVIYSPDASANIDIQKELFDAQEEQLRAAEQDLILDASNLYFNALQAKANIQIQSENLKVTRRNLRVAESNFAAGQAGRGDVLRLTSQNSQDLQSLIESINLLEEAFHSINQLLNNPIDREIDVRDLVTQEKPFEEDGFRHLRTVLDDPSKRFPFEDFLVAKALENSPEIIELDLRLRANQRTIVLNGKRRFLPTVAANAQYDWTLDQGGAGVPDPSIPSVDGYYSAGLTFSIKLFDSNSRNIDLRSAELQRDQLALNRKSVAVEIETRVRNAVLEMINQLSNYQLSKVSQEAAAESLELTQAAFTNGAVDLVDLLDAQADHLQAQLALTSAEFGFLSTGMVLGRLVGHYFLLSTDDENRAFLGASFSHFPEAYRGDKPDHELSHK